MKLRRTTKVGFVVLLITTLLSGMFTFSFFPTVAKAEINNTTNPSLQPMIWDFYMNSTIPHSPGLPDYNFEGWNSFENLSVSTSDRALQLNVTGANGSFLSEDNLSLDALNYKSFKIKLKNNTAANEMLVYFMTDADPNWQAVNVANVTLQPNDAIYREYVVDFSSYESWTGHIKQFKIYPANNASTGTISIDQMGVYPDSAPSDILFKFSNDAQGFNDFTNSTNRLFDSSVTTSLNATSSLVNSALNVAVTGIDPSFKSPDNLALATAYFKYIKIKMRNGTSASTAKIYFTTTADTTWNASKSASFTIIPNDPNLTEYLVDMSAVSLWIGSIKQLQFNLTTEASYGTLAIESIGIYTGELLPDIAYDFGNGNDGWTASYQSTISASNGILTESNTGGDPQILSPDGLQIHAAKYKYIKIRMKNNTKSSFGTMYWTTTTDTSWDEKKSQNFIIIPNSSGYMEYMIGLSQNQYWKDTIKQIRLDPSNHAPSGSSNIDYFVLTPSANVTSQNRYMDEGVVDETGPYISGWEINENGGYVANSYDEKGKTPYTEYKKGPSLDAKDDFNTGFNDWHAYNNSVVSVTYGILTAHVTDSVYMQIEKQGNWSSNRFMKIRLKNNTSDVSAAVYFTDLNNPSYSENNRVNFTITPNDATFKEYIIDMKANSQWGNANVLSIRLDLARNANNGTVDIDYISLSANNSPGNQSFSQFDEQGVWSGDGEFINDGTGKAVEAWKVIPEQNAGTLKWNFRFALNNSSINDVTWKLTNNSSRQDVIKFITKNGSLNYVKPDASLSSISSLQAFQWYNVQVVMNMTNYTYSVWVNGSQVASSVAFITNSSIDKVFVGTTGSSSVRMLFGHRIYKVAEVHEDFIGDSVGSSPIGVTFSGTGSANIQTLRTGSMDEHYVDLKDTSSTQQASITKSFSTSSNLIESVINFAVPVKMDNIQIKLSQNTNDAIIVTTNGGNLNYLDSNGASHVLWTNYKANVWYTLKVRAYIGEGTASYSINGTTIAQSIPFHHPVSDLNQLKVSTGASETGNVVIKDITVRDYQPSTVPYIDSVNNPDGLIGVQNWSALGTEANDRTYGKVKSSDKLSYLGYSTEENNKDAVDWQIKWMAENGIDFSSMFYYRKGKINDPLVSGGHRILDSYLDEAEHQSKVKFAITISFEGMRYQGQTDFMNNVLPFITERYLRNPNYVKVDNQPVIMIYGTAAQLNAAFNNNVSSVLAAIESQLQQDGFDGAIFIANCSSTAEAQQMKAMGIDYAYAYWGRTDISTLSDWKNKMTAGGLDGIASPGPGQDPRYWWPLELNPSFISSRTPSQFYNFLQYTKNTYMASYPANSLANKMVLMENWGEYAEGHSIAPSNLYGFGYVNAIRKTFTAANDNLMNVRPQAPLDARYSKGWKQELLQNGDFEKGTAFWSPTFSGSVASVASSDFWNDNFAAKVFNRTSPYTGIAQDVTDQVLQNGNGATYELSAYIKEMPGSSSVVSGAKYTITNASNSGYLTPPLYSTINGDPLGQLASLGRTLQNWTFIDAGGGYYKIKNERTGKLVSIDSTNGARVVQWDDIVGSDPVNGDNELWRLVKAQPLLSQGETASASSSQTGNEASKGNDGSTATRWGASDGTYPQWWKVDLGLSQNLSKVDINWFNSSSSSRAYKYKIETSNDDITYTVQVDKTNNSTYELTSDALSNVTARYVRVTVTGSTLSWASASATEINVYGVGEGSSYEIINKRNGKALTVPNSNSVWNLNQITTPNQAIVYVQTKDDTGVHYFTVNGKADNVSYRNLHGSVKITWTGKLQYAVFQVRGNGDNTNEFYVDEASMRYDNASVVIDKTPMPTPKTTAALTPRQPDGLNGWYVHPVTVSFSVYDSVYDNNSGFAKTEYSLDGGHTWQNYATPVTFDQDAKYTVSYRSTDKAGKVEEVQSLSLNLDKTAPEVVLTQSGHSVGDVEADASLTFELSSTDSLSGVAEQSLTLDGAVIASGQAIPAGTLAPGTHTVSYRVMDAAGHTTEASISFQVKNPPVVDTSAPGMPELSSNSGHANGLQDGNYIVTMNMWWGQNGSQFKLYENGVLISTMNLTKATPAAQTATWMAEGKANGTYTYVGELINSVGKTTSQPLVVKVTDARPGKAVLAADNWDGDGNFMVSMNLWWGTNATEYRLYENGALIDSKSLTAATPNAQTAATVISGKAVGVYEYRCELVNAAGATSSDKLTVTVSH
ncbi:OmpL47-type beta-barrel domain-containing protein [Paenibacillus sp. NPDC056579]|uniref:OmpL47-type beta-barrel domain-containing protein n=1 Tax=Paenibacillus sp. NPDC056579 TaxID=3345871 RepID=UPI0036B24C36